MLLGQSNPTAPYLNIIILMLLEESKENLHDLFLVISHPLTIQLNENVNEFMKERMNEGLINALLNECIIELMNEQKII